MNNNNYFWISVPVFADISKRTPEKIRKDYSKLITNDCIPLKDVPKKYQDIYVNEFLLRGKVIDFPLINAVKDYADPLHDSNIQILFNEMKMMQEAMYITSTCKGSITAKLKELAKKYNMSYASLCRRRKEYMSITPLKLILKRNQPDDSFNDNRPTCCKMCRVLIAYKHQKAGKIHASKIYRDIKNSKPYPCSQCPFKNKGCQRNACFMAVPNCQDTVERVITEIPEQLDVLAIDGIREWEAYFSHKTIRKKPDIVNHVWFSDHKCLDIFVRTHQNPDGSWVLRRPWITAILDAASNVMVAYVLSLNPNSDCIAEAFARACVFTVDTPYHGIPNFFYCDQGKDYRSNLMKGMANTPEEPLILNKDFSDSGLLEWFGIKNVVSLPYHGWSKTIEAIWKTIDDEWIRPLPGYCGSDNKVRPYVLSKQIKDNNIYTFEQFADYFADTIYYEYNNFTLGGTRPSPNELYSSLPKASTLVPTWSTLAVLKSKSQPRSLRDNGIKYDYGTYWCSVFSALVEHEKNTEFRIFNFDSPFNRSLSIVKDHKYIGEAFLVEGLNLVEENRHKLLEHLIEQREQKRFYSKRIEQIHSVIIEGNILEYTDKVPAVDHIRYGQRIDTIKDSTQATDNNLIPNELKEQFINHHKNFWNIDNQREEDDTDMINEMLKERGRAFKEGANT